jgi:hypothetical protein
LQQVRTVIADPSLMYALVVCYMGAPDIRIRMSIALLICAVAVCRTGRKRTKKSRDARWTDTLHIFMMNSGSWRQAILGV